MSSRVRVNTAHLVAVPGGPGRGRRPASTRPPASPTFSMAASMLGAVEASIGWRGRPTCRWNSRSPGTPRGQGGLGHRAEGPAQHQGPPHLGPGDPGGLGDGLDHHPLQRALAQLAREQADQEPLLGRGGPAEQLGHQPPPLGLRPGPGQPADPLEGGVDLGHGQGRARPPGRARPAAPPSRPRSGAGAARRRGTPPPGGPRPAPGAAGRPPAAPPWPGGRSWRRRRRTSRRPRRAARGHCPRTTGWTTGEGWPEGWRSGRFPA